MPFIKDETIVLGFKLGIGFIVAQAVVSLGTVVLVAVGTGLATLLARV